MNRCSEGGAAHEPYVGLRAYHADDAYRFFGRDREAQELVYQWQANRLTILHGPSGVGKTSLIQAGVLPLLDPEFTDALPVGRVSYGSVFPSVGGSAFPTAALPPHHNPLVFALLASLAPRLPLSRLAGLTLESLLLSRPFRHDEFGDDIPRLLAIDQAEELFDEAAGRQHSRAVFFDQLKGALDADQNIRLLICVRDDHLAGITAHAKDLVGKDHHCVRLEPLEDAQARQAVEGPVRDTGRVYHRSAVNKLLRDVGGESKAQYRVEPARLQVACLMLWRSLSGQTKSITVDDVGDMAAADAGVDDFCTMMVAEVATAHLKGDTTKLMAWLARTFITQLVNRRRVQQRAGTIGGMDTRVVEALVARDILNRDRAGWCELAHDRLIQPILRAAGPIDLSILAIPDDLLGSAEVALRSRDYGLARTQAVEALNAATGDRGLQAEIHVFLGNIAHAENRVSEAINHYQQAAEMFEALTAFESVGGLLVGIGRLRLAENRPDLAVEELTAALGRYPDDLSIKTALAWALWHDGAPEAARDTVTDVLSEDSGAVDALQVRGETLASMGDWSGAWADLDLAKPLQWPSTKAAYALVTVRLANGELSDDAQQELEKEIGAIVADAPDSGPVHLYVAWITSAQGKGEYARVHARYALHAQGPALPVHLRDAAAWIAGST